jgi:branched-chain amino acid transport system substrate-binding protein
MIGFRAFTRRAVLAGAASMVLLAGIAANIGAEEPKPVRIGYSIAKTGFLAVATPVQTQAYELWREQVNARGGLDIGGKERRPVEFVVYDDQSEPAKAAQIYEKLITGDKVDLLLTPYATPLHIAIAPVLERHKFPAVGSTASSTLVRDLDVKYLWFVEKLPDQYGIELARMLAALGVKSTAALTLQLPLSLETKQYLVPELGQNGIEIKVDQEYPPDIKDMTGMLTTVRSAAPEAVIGLTYPEDSILYMTTARELGLRADFQFLLIGPAIPFFADRFGKNLDGIVTIGHWSPHQQAWPKARPFYDAYVKRWGERPDYLDSVSSYMSVEVLEQAVAVAGLDHEKLRETIATQTFDTINGPVRFEGVVNVSTPTGFLQIQDGEAQIIWPPEVATSKFKPKGPWAE